MGEAESGAARRTADDIDTVVGPASGAPRSLPDPTKTLAGRGAPMRYIEGDVLGIGGMGKVVAAIDELIGREVALKRLAPHVDTFRDLRARFLREALIQARLDHPSVVPVHDIGVDEEDHPFFTMRRVRGRTLRDLLAEPPDSLGRRRLVSALVQVCLAIDYAHQHGFVHRDLKPPNVMLGDFGEVYVLDWGVAREIGAPELPSDAKAAPLEGLTEAGAQLGTPGYMAPEQIQAPSEVGPAADVYALGAMVFEIFAGEPLHPGSRDERIRSTLAGAARLLGRATDPTYEGALDAAIARATALDPSVRGTARTLADGLEAWLGGARDREQRRAWADQLRDEAQEAQTRSDAAGRALAIRLLGRAVALDPGNVSTLERLIALLREDGDAVIPAVEDLLLREDEARVRRSGNIGQFGFLIVGLAALVLSGVMGVARPAAVALVVAIAVLCGLMSAILARMARVPRPGMIVLVAMTFAFGASLSGFFGPFIGVPSFAALLASLFIMDMPRLSRWVGLFALLALVGPLVLELVGVLPRSFEVVGGNIVLHPRLITFRDPAMAAVTMFVLNASGLVAPFLLSRMRESEDRLRRREAQRNWRIEQLLPDDDRP